MAFMKFLYRLSSSSIGWLLVEPRVRRCVLGIVRNYVLVFGNASTIQAVLSIAAGGTLGSRSVRHAVPAGRVEAEQLGADSLVLEAGRCPPIAPALGVQREERSGQGAAKGFVLVRRVVQATGGVTIEEMMETLNTAR